MSEATGSTIAKDNLNNKKIIHLLRVTKDKKFQRCYAELVSLKEHELVVKKKNGQVITAYSNYNLFDMIRGNTLLGFMLKGEIHPMPLKMQDDKYDPSMIIENYNKKFSLQQDELYQTSWEKLNNIKDEAARMVRALQEIFDPQKLLNFETLIQKITPPSPVYAVENEFSPSALKNKSKDAMKSNIGAGLKENTKKKAKDSSFVDYEQDPRYFKR